jgi:hypothetical protein
VAFEFVKSSCVIVGTFNVNVVQPRYLAEMDVFPKETKLSLMVNVTKPGLRFSVEDSPFEWQVSPEKVLVETTSENDECGPQAAKMLEALKWTPLSAVGLNTVLKAPREFAKTLLPNVFGDEIVCPKGFTVGPRTWHMALMEDGIRHNIQVSQMDDDCHLSLNTHAAFEDSSSPIENNAKVCDLLNRSREYREIALDAAHDLLNWKGDHDIRNAV